VTERQVEISHDRYAAQAPVRQFTTTRLEISIATTEVSDTRRGSVGIPETGRKPMSVDGSNHRRVEGVFEEINVPAKPKQN
jgi:hypothetical protein